MESRKTQAELEQPAKVYQLEAVAKDVIDIKAILGVIKDQTSGLVSNAQLEISEKKQEGYTDKAVKEAISKVHLEYRPFKNGAYWFASIIILAVVGSVFATWKAISGI